MNEVFFLLLGFILPLFPLSMLFNDLLARVRPFILRASLLLLWPQLGLGLLSLIPDTTLPSWIAPMALLTSALYAFRAIAARELGQWSGYIATSLWALLWLFLVKTGKPSAITHAHALGFSLPLVLLAALGNSIEQRFGAAYTGLYGGLAQSMPRLSGTLVLVVLGCIATPVFPSFFSMTQLIFLEISVSPLFAVVLLLVWLFWSWSGIRLLQGLIIGSADRVRHAMDIKDISMTSAWGYAIVLVVLCGSSLYILGMAP